MAKKASPSTGLIVTLVFFVLTTFIAGAVAYFGYSDLANAEKQAKDAKEAAQKAEAEAQSQEARKLLLRIALGMSDQGDNDRDNFKFLVSQGKRGPQVMEEYRDLMAKLGGKLPNKDLAWNLTGDTPDPSPAKTIAQIVSDYAESAQKANTEKQTAENGRQKADQLRAAAEDKLRNEKAVYDASLKKLQEELDKSNKDKTKNFNDYQANLAKKGEEIQQVVREKQALEDKLLKEIEFLTKKRNELTELVAKYENRRDSGPDLARLDQKKGSVDRRDGSFVYIDIGSASYLRPQITFTVLPGEGTWRNAEERERQIKGQVEVIEILGPYSARAKVLFEASPIRNPIRAHDQLFNVAWTPGAQEHIAFAGIIDLNGDGLDDNLDFIRFLEKQGCVIDSWLDLRDRQIKGKGMTLQTKFLVLGPQVEIGEEEGKRADKDPRVAAKQEILNQMGKMKQEAKNLGVQTIDYRKFLAMIGYKVPERPAPPEYGASAYIRRGDGVAQPKEGDDTPEPEPKAKKKDEGR